MSSVYRCSHTICDHTQSDGSRAVYQAPAACTKHERDIRHHEICTMEICNTCVRLGDKRTGTGRQQSKLLPCRHHNGCCRSFTDTSTRNAHERDDHPLCSGCKRCLQNQQNQNRKRNREALAKAQEEQHQLEQEQRTKETEMMKTKLLTIPWDSILNATARESTQTLLHRQAKALLECLLPHTSYEAALETLIQGNPKTIHYLQTHMEDFQSISLSQPSLEVLLSYKDTLNITDKKWTHTMAVFGLDSRVSLHHITRAKHALSASMEPQPTPGGRGWEFPLLKYIKWVLAQREQNIETQDKTQKLIIKFAWDGAIMTRNNKRKQEIGTFNIVMEEQTLAESKSAHNVHQYVIFLGEETRETLADELANAAKTIRSLVAGTPIEVNNATYILEPVMVCDMAALVTLQGLYQVYHPSSIYKCPWCKVTADKLHMWELDWPLRDLKEMMETGSQTEGFSESKRKEWAKNHEGMRDKPLIEIDLQHTIPCNLHVFMAIMRKLVELLAEETAHNTELAEEWECVMKTLKITLPAKNNTGKKTFIQRIKKARIGRPDYLHILKSRELFFIHLDGTDEQGEAGTDEQGEAGTDEQGEAGTDEQGEAGTDEQEETDTEEETDTDEQGEAGINNIKRSRSKDIRSVWTEYYRLASLTMQPRVSVSISFSCPIFNLFVFNVGEYNTTRMETRSNQIPLLPVIQQKKSHPICTYSFNMWDST